MFIQCMKLKCQNIILCQCLGFNKIFIQMQFFVQSKLVGLTKNRYIAKVLQYFIYYLAHMQGVPHKNVPV